MTFTSVVEGVAGMSCIVFVIALVGALGGDWSWQWVLGIGLFGIGTAALGGWLSSDEKQGEQGTASGRNKELMRFGFHAAVEFYTNQRIAEGLRCKITVQGMDDYMHHYAPGGWTSAKLDAVYLLGGGLFSRHDSLLFDGQPAVVFEEDPPQHRFSFLYTGTGKHLSMLLRIPKEHKCSHAWEQTTKPLAVTIRTLSPEEEVKVKAMEDEQQRETAKMHQEELNRQALELAAVAYVETNFLDEKYQQNYATKHTVEILKTFGPQWRADYLALLSNEPLYALVQEQHPHVLEFVEARLETIRIAQRLAVAPTPPPQLETKPKITPEEWQARIERYRQRSLTRKRVKVEDYKADVMQDLELLQEFIADLDNYPLDEDERERLIQEFKERLLGGEEEAGNGFKQL